MGEPLFSVRWKPCAPSVLASKLPSATSRKHRASIPNYGKEVGQANFSVGLRPTREKSSRFPQHMLEYVGGSWEETLPESPMNLMNLQALLGNLGTNAFELRLSCEKP